VFGASGAVPAVVASVPTLLLAPLTPPHAASEKSVHSAQAIRHGALSSEILVNNWRASFIGLTLVMSSQRSHPM